MDKKEALKILIENTELFSEEIRARFVSAIPQMSASDIDDLGLMLARMKEIDMEGAEKDLKEIDEFLVKHENSR